MLAAAAVALALTLPASASADRWIRIEPNDLTPSTVTVDAGEAAHFINESGEERTVTAGDGTFASGGIPNRGGYSVAVSVPGAHPFTSGGLAGVLHVRLGSLDGPSFEPANHHIPDYAFPPVEEGDFAVDPQTAVESSQSRLIVGLTALATVAEANGALAAPGSRSSAASRSSACC